MTNEQAKNLKRGDKVRVKQYPNEEGLLVTIKKNGKEFEVYSNGKLIRDARPSDLTLIKERSIEDAEYMKGKE